MNNDELLKVSSAADMIVCGYAFTKTEDSNIRVLDLKEPHHALFMSQQGEVFETTMDDVELSIVEGYWDKNRKYMEESEFIKDNYKEMYLCWAKMSPNGFYNG